MSIPPRGKTAMRRQATAESLRWSGKYYRRGRTISLVLQAEVKGGQYEPYRVRVTFDEGDITNLEREQLQNLLVHLATCDPSDTLHTSTPPSRRTPVGPQPIRRRVDSYWMVYISYIFTAFNPKRI